MFKNSATKETLLKVGDITLHGKIKEVYHHVEEDYYQYLIGKNWFHQNSVSAYPTTDNTFLEIRAYLNGNLHLKFSQKFMRAFNIEAARLNGWIKSPREATEELDISLEEATELFKSGFKLEANNMPLLLS